MAIINDEARCVGAITEARLAEIEARAKAATFGPWEYSEMSPLSGGLYFWAEINTSDDTHTVAEVDNVGAIIIAPGLNVPKLPQYKADGDFIASSRTDVPDLVAEVRRLRELIAETDHENDCSAMVNPQYPCNCFKFKAVAHA